MKHLPQASVHEHLVPSWWHYDLGRLWSLQRVESQWRKQGLEVGLEPGPTYCLLSASSLQGQ